MTTIILSLILACTIVLAVVLHLKNEPLTNELNEANLEIEKLKKSLEMSNALKQLLRNEVKVLNAQLQHPPAVEEVKKKKYHPKKTAPKMSANKTEHK